MIIKPQSEMRHSLDSALRGDDALMLDQGKNGYLHIHATDGIFLLIFKTLSL